MFRRAGKGECPSKNGIQSPPRPEKLPAKTAESAKKIQIHILSLRRKWLADDSGKKCGFLHPEGVRHTSPGQRPGVKLEKYSALKGRYIIVNDQQKMHFLKKIKSKYPRTAPEKLPAKNAKNTKKIQMYPSDSQI